MTLRSIIVMLCFMLVSVSAFSDSSSLFVIDSVQITGLKVTKRSTVLRELPFKIGDLVQSNRLEAMLEEARSNITNTSLFNVFTVNEVHQEDKEGGPKHLTILIDVEERWYIWPVVDIILEDRNISSWLNEGDLSRVTFNLGARVENLLGTNNQCQLSAMVGFQRGFKVQLNNIALDAKARQLIDVSFRMGLMRTENVISENDKPIYVKTYDRFISETYRANFVYRFRENVRRRHIASVDVEHVALDDTVLTINPGYWGNESKQRVNMRLNYTFQLDNRDYYRYPTKGYYVKAALETYASHDFSVRYAQLSTDLQFYHPLHRRWFVGTELKLGTSLRNSSAYVLDRAIGYGGVNLRGYEYNVADGQHYAVSNNTLSFNVLPKKIIAIPFLKAIPQFHKIHFNIFARIYGDLGYAVNNNPHSTGRLSNRLLMSSGVGIDIATFYDIIFSIDYAFNREGTPGFFFQLRAPFM